MIVKVDLSGLESQLTLAKEEMRKLPREMKRIADSGAHLERSTHRYINRTGNLQSSTLTRYSRGAAAVSLEMGMDYASFVIKRGLSQFNAIAREVEQEITKYVDAMTVRISRA